jgi:subtilisin family serine protease
MDDGKQADDILSTFWTASAGSSYAYLAGSSMATAFVSGALANLISLGLTPAAAADRLVATARPMGNAARFGAGEVDLPAAVTGLPGGAGAPSAPIAAAAAPLGGPATPAAALNATPPRRSGRMPAPGIVMPASPFASPARSQALVKGHPLDVSPPFVGFATMLVAGGTVLKIRARTLRRQAEATVG